SILLACSLARLISLAGFYLNQFSSLARSRGSSLSPDSTFVKIDERAQGVQVPLSRTNTRTASQLAIQPATLLNTRLHDNQTNGDLTRP
ncbi:hypothetical protein IFM58399_09990.1, partial [Aspergillus lentulus]|uniref:uncharacterized protein n=1 Tax=Aspergillus lentulus TaxID=293939 RepID=UPI001393B829